MDFSMQLFSEELFFKLNTEALLMIQLSNAYFGGN